MQTKKSWAEKLRSSKPHEVKPAPRDMAGMKKGEMMLIPSAQIVDAFLRAIPKGSTMEPKSFRRGLAAQYGAEVSCPITTGIQLRIVAEAAYEAYEKGTDVGAITPFWRVVDEGSPTAAKLACGVNFITQQRTRESKESK